MSVLSAAADEAPPSGQSDSMEALQLEEPSLADTEKPQTGLADAQLPLGPASVGEGTLTGAQAEEDRALEPQQEDSAAPQDSDLTPASDATQPYAGALQAFADAMQMLSAAEAAKAAQILAAEESAAQSGAVTAAAAAEFAALLDAAIGKAYSPQGADARTELLSLRDALVEKDNELASLRLRSLQVAERVGTAPAAARKTQREGEGMHALDFEQLTIETQSMTEKSEARALAVLSLKAKRTTAVQVLAHVRMKLHAVKGMRTATTERLVEARAALAAQQEELRGLKASRDRERAAIKRLQEAQQQVAPHALLRGVEAQRQQILALRDSISQLEFKADGRTR